MTSYQEKTNKQNQSKTKQQPNNKTPKETKNLFFHPTCYLCFEIWKHLGLMFYYVVRDIGIYVLGFSYFVDS